MPDQLLYHENHAPGSEEPVNFSLFQRTSLLFELCYSQGLNYISCLISKPDTKTVISVLVNKDKLLGPIPKS